MKGYASHYRTPFAFYTILCPLFSQRDIHRVYHVLYNCQFNAL
uniref:Uncharacterized protein n=1 Tax=uncultured bacterium contig00024 TaxID=1181513 RepID=A0A806JZD3_9BACT|nr:hypothetical protein [uncultured bacterium contig00024]